MRMRSRLCACSAALATTVPSTTLPARAGACGDDRGGGIERREQAADEEPSAPDDAPAAPDDGPAAAEDPVEVDDPADPPVEPAQIAPVEDDSQKAASEEESPETGTGTVGDGAVPTEEAPEPTQERSEERRGGR